MVKKGWKQGGDSMKEYLEVKRLLLERTQLELNDPRISNYWVVIVDSFGDNEQIMIDVLNMCSEFEIDWLREVFEDLAFKFPSKKYINTLEMLQEKYPNVDIESDIHL